MIGFNNLGEFLNYHADKTVTRFVADKEFRSNVMSKQVYLCKTERRTYEALLRFYLVSGAIKLIEAGVSFFKMSPVLAVRVQGSDYYYGFHDDSINGLTIH